MRHIILEHSKQEKFIHAWKPKQDRLLAFGRKKKQPYQPVRRHHFIHLSSQMSLCFCSFQGYAFLDPFTLQIPILPNFLCLRLQPCILKPHQSLPITQSFLPLLLLQLLNPSSSSPLGWYSPFFSSFVSLSDCYGSNM